MSELRKGEKILGNLHNWKMQKFGKKIKNVEKISVKVIKAMSG